MSFFQAWSGYRAFQKLSQDERRIVFYAESADSYVHFEPVLRQLTGPHNQLVCYLTSSASDPILRTAETNILPFFVGDGFFRTSLFLGLKAGVTVMTMPDLETFHIKRSKAHPVHYVYLFHSMVSTHMIYRKRAFDHFDTILCGGPHQIQELRAAEQVYRLKEKNLVPHGYGRLDSILERVKRGSARARQGEPKKILLAPSWGPSGILEAYGLPLLRSLLETGAEVTVRPHPMTLRSKKTQGRILEIKRALGGDRIQWDFDITSEASFFEADVLISDWSGVAMEYAFGLLKPVLFIDVPRKVNNPEYAKIPFEPLEVRIREKIGKVISPQRLADIPEALAELCRDGEKYRSEIERQRNENVFHVCESGAIGARALLRIAEAVLV